MTCLVACDAVCVCVCVCGGGGGGGGGGILSACRPLHNQVSIIMLETKHAARMMLATSTSIIFGYMLHACFICRISFWDFEEQ